MIDLAIAVEQIYGVADYGSASTYEQLQETWRDDRPIPSLKDLQQAWLEFQQIQPPNWEGFILAFAECLDCFAALIPNQDARTLIVAAINNASQSPQSAAVHLGQAQAYWNRFAVAETEAIAALKALCQSNHMPFALDDNGHLVIV